GLSTTTVGAVTVASGAAFTVPAGYDGNTDLVAAFDNNNRKPIAVTFQQISSAESFTAVMNHFKSKGSSAGGTGDTDTNDGQGNSNGTRVRASKDLKAWLATNPTGTTDTDYLIMGDLNAYAKEDPITELETVYTNLLPLSTYSYAFDGAWGSLDHALGSTSLTTQLAGAAKWHINADEPTSLDYNTQLDPSAIVSNKVIKTPAQTTSLYAANAFRSSDHDPVVVGLNLGSGFSVSASALSNSNYTVGATGTATSTITVNRTSFTDPVTLSLEVSPANAGITGSFTNNPNSSGTSTLNLSVDNTVFAGTYTLTVKGTFGAMVMSSNTFNIVVAPICISLSVTPNNASIAVGATQQLTANFLPSGCTAPTVTWSNGGSTFATVNTSGLVLGASVGSGTIITATAGAINGTSTINVTASVSVTGLVINEVDYDQIGTDSTEYIEIYNPTASAVSLAGIKVFLVNGGASGNPSYTIVDLSSGVSLAANSYLVIANTTFLGTITASVEIAFAGTNDQIQNGSPDGIALVNTNTNSIVDALSYEGSITAATLAGISGTFNLVEGTALPAPIADSNIVVGALIRSPNGKDTNNAFADWTTTPTLSPGAAN
ncbi:MAG: hypothetical protein RLZZ156_1198, partial [Deinococcota bacterium]